MCYTVDVLFVWRKEKKSVYWHFEALYNFIIWPELICLLFTISISLMFDCFWDFKSFTPVSKIPIFCSDFCNFWLKKGFKTEEEMAKCLAKAQMEAELDNALKQLELETRKCINRRLKKSGIDKKYHENCMPAILILSNDNKFSVTVKHK